MSKVFGRPIYWIGNLISAAIFYLFYYLGSAGILTGYSLLFGALLAAAGAASTLAYVLKTNSRIREREEDHDERVA